MRLPLTLWRYAFGELWRIILISAGVLVVVISFAATVRYTAAGKLGPLETLTFMFYAIPPMLQYALPFAAGFGATLAYHRMTQDNEMTAAAASGISHRAILAPALITGGILAIVLWLLAGQVIPRFLRHMELMITEDAKKILVASIKAGRSVEFAGKMIQASRVHELPDTDGKGSRIVLVDVGAISVDPAGNVIGEYFAKRAWVNFLTAADGPETSSTPSCTYITMTMENAVVLQPGEGIANGNFTLGKAISASFNDDPKFLTTGELAELPDHPDRNNVVDGNRRRVAAMVAERQVIATISQTLRKDKHITVFDPDGREYTIRAGGIERRGGGTRWELLPIAPGKDIEVEQSAIPVQGRRPDPSGSTRFIAKTAGLTSDPAESDAPTGVSLSLTMENVAAQSVARLNDNEAMGVSVSREYHLLTLADKGTDLVMSMPSRELLGEIDRRGLQSDPVIKVGAAELLDRVDNLTRNVISKQHERVADAVACMVMVFAGAVTSMRLSNRMPLTVYLWSFFPALLAVVTISSGQQTTRHMGLHGLGVLWAGVAVVAAYAAGAYWIVRRH